MNNFKVNSEIKTKKTIEETLNNLFIEILKNDEIDEAFEGFTEKGLKKTFEIVTNLESLSYTNLINKLDKFSNNRDKMNFLFRIPIIVEVNEALEAIKQKVSSANQFLFAIVEKLNLNKDEAYKSFQNLLKEILKADTESVLKVSITLLQGMRK